MNSDEITFVTSTLYIHDHLPPKADLGIWHGSSYIKGVTLLGNLHNEGRVTNILVTGGNNPKLGDNEGIRARAFLIEMGVPCERIICECNSGDTRQNIDLIMRTLIVRLGLDSLTSINVCTMWWHMRRALMTVARHFPPGTRFFPLNVFSPNSSLENWHTDQIRSEQVKAEISKTEKYMALGHLAPIVRHESGYFTIDEGSAVLV